MAIRGLSCVVVAALLLPSGVFAQSPAPSPEAVAAERVTLPDGRAISLACSGPALTPHPVVLLEADLGRAAGTWSSVQVALPDDVRACAYDRPGTGASSAVTDVRAPDDDLADLRAGLAAAGVPAPYLLVADGVGAWWASAFALAHPDEVIGAVFVEPVSPTRDAELRALLSQPAAGEPSAVAPFREALDAFLTAPATTPGHADLRRLASRARSLMLDDRPLVLLEAAEPTSVLGRRTRPVGPRPRADGADPWPDAWSRIAAWAPTRSTTVTRRELPGAEGIVQRRPEAVADAIMDVVAATGIDRAPGRTVARLTLPGATRDGAETWVEDRSGMLARVRPATRAELARLLRGRTDRAVVRVLDDERTRLGVAWWSRSAPCRPDARVVLDRDQARVTIDLVGPDPDCRTRATDQAVVLELRQPLAHHELTAGIASAGPTFGRRPSRLVVDGPGATGTDQVEVVDETGRMRRARALTGAELRGGWNGAPGGLQTTRRAGETLVRWPASACVPWARVTVLDTGSITAENGAAPACDPAPRLRGVALRFAGDGPGGLPVSEVSAAVTVPEAILREQAEAVATSVSLVDYTVRGARLAQAGELDARLDPSDRWVWAVALGNPAGNDVCPDGITWEGPPCPNLSSLTVYLDALTGELLGTVPGAF